MKVNINSDARGTLGVVEFSDLPFSPARTFWIAGVPGGETRGNHAHRRCEQFIIPLAGRAAFQVLTRSGSSTAGVLHPGEGLYLKTFEWIILDEFTEDAVVLVYCSTPYEESDYIRDFDEFRRS